MPIKGSYARWRHTRGYWIGGGPIQPAMALRPSFEALLLSSLQLHRQPPSSGEARRRSIRDLSDALSRGLPGNRMPEIKYLGQLSLEQIKQRLQGDGSDWKRRLPFGLVAPVDDARLLPLALSTKRRPFSVELDDDLIVKGDVWCSLYLFKYLTLSLEFFTEWRPHLDAAMLIRAQRQTMPDSGEAPFSANFASAPARNFVDLVLRGIEHSLSGKPCLEAVTPWYLTSGVRLAKRERSRFAELKAWGQVSGQLETFCGDAPLLIFDRVCHFDEADTYRTLYTPEPVLLPMRQDKTADRVEFVARIHDLAWVQRSLLELIRRFSSDGANRLRELEAGSTAKLLLTNEQTWGDRAAFLLGVMRVSDGALSRNSRSSMAWQRRVYSAISAAHSIPAQRTTAFRGMRKFLMNLWGARIKRWQLFSVLVDVFGKLAQLIQR